MKNLLQLLPKVRAGIFSIILLHILQPRAMAQGDQTSISITMNSWGGTTGAWLHLPDDYNSTSERYPLILFFHGVGEGGTDVNKVLVNGLPKAIANGAKMQFTVNGKLFKFIVVSPQASSGWMNAQGVDAVLEFIKSKYRIDESRVYLTGLSAGGYAAWNYVSAGSNYAQKIAAVVPVSAAGVDNEAGLCNFASSNVKLWTLCGSNDQFIDVVDKYLNIINACNPQTKAIKTITQGAGHSGSFWDQAYSVTNTYNNPNIYQWMLQYSRADVGTPTNTLPTANAGADATVTLPASASLDGSASKDSDGSITKYAWTKQSGPASGTITTAAAAKTTVTGLAAGTYVFRLTVTDNSGGTAYDDVTITVKSATNTAPVANAGSNVTVTLPTSTTTLDGSASSDAEGAVTYAWSKTSGPAGGAITAATSAKTSVTGLVAGTYVYQLTVKDAEGLTNSASVTVTVNAAAAVTPVAKVAVSSISIKLPTNATTLDGSSSTGSITSYAWTKTSGPAGGAIASASSSTTSISGLAVGTYIYQLKVTNTATGESSTAVVTVTVTAAAPSGDCGCKLTVTPGSDGGVYMDGSNKGLQPGDTVCLKAGKYTYVEFFNFNGTAEKPIVFINCGGIVESGDGGDRGFSFHDCKYFKFTGSGTGDKYGFKSNGGSKYIPSGFSAGRGCTDYEVERLEITKTEAGMLCKINPDCDPNSWYPNFAIRNLKFHDLYIHDVLGEGMYIGHTSQSGVDVTCNGVTESHPPPRIYNCKVYNVITDGTGWDGIQVSGVPEGLEIYNNTILNYGIENKGSQQAGIIFGGEGVGSIHDNLVSKGTGNGMQIFGSTHIEVYNNIVNEAGYDGTSAGQDAIFIDDKPTKQLYKPIQVYVFNNTIVKSKRAGIMFYNSQGTVASGNLFYNNLIVAPGSAASGDKKYLEIDATINYQGANNYYEPDINKILFVNPAGNDFHLQAGSPAIDKGQDLTSYGLKRDFDGDSRPYGAAFDAGADEFTGGAAPTNKPPVANAGTDITVTLPANASLDGSGSTDSDGTIAKYAWVKKSGPAGGTITTAGAAKTTVTALAEGTYVFTLTVTDDKGATDTDDITVTVKPDVNNAPAANAGADVTITLPVSTVNLDGSSSVDDGTIAGYAWVKQSGPAGGAIASPAAAVTDITGLTEGTYVYKLTVTDDKGLTGTDEVTIIVNAAPNDPPVANAGADVSITLPVSTASFDGSGSSDDGTIAAYAWTKQSGPTGGAITSPSAAVTNITGLTEGFYVFRLTVTDDKGATSFDDVTITVKPEPVNAVPVANAGADITITLPVNTAAFDGSTSSDSDGSIAKYAWTKESGPAGGAIASAATAKTNITGLTEGTYVFRLTITDDRGATAYDEVTITVNPEPINEDPIAKAGNDVSVVLPTNSVALDGGESVDNDGSIASYAWSKQSGPSGGAVASPNSAKTNITGLTEGTYVFRLTVTDNKGATAYDEVTVTVKPPASNNDPVANAGADIIITLPTSSAALDGSASADSDGSIAKYAWVKVSGPNGGTITSTSSAKTTITGLTEGTYVYRLTVTDNNNATASDEITITVKPEVINTRPVANAGNDITITLPTSNVTLDGSASSDAEGPLSGYQWKKVSGPTGGSIANSASVSTNISGLTEGTYVFSLTVTDQGGLTSIATVTVVVNPEPNKPPVVYAGPDITITLPVNSTTLDGSLSYDPDGTIVKYQWRKVSGPSGFAFANGSSAKTLLTNLSDGTYVFELTATDNKGLTASDLITVTVQSIANIAPVSNAGTDITITLPVAETTLNGSASTDADGRIVSYIWTQIYGPATIIGATDAAVTSLGGLTEGTYMFELTVKDDKGATSSSRVTITVKPAANNGPVAKAGADKTVTLPVVVVELDGSGSYDPDGTITQYSWKKISGPTEGSLVNANASKPTLVGLVPGEYEFELTVTDDKFETATDVIKVSVKDPEDEKMKVDLYPNPATTFVKVVIKAKELKNVNITVYGANGQVLRQMKLAELNGRWTDDINLELLPCGMYVLKVVSEDYSYSKTFIKVAH